MYHWRYYLLNLAKFWSCKTWLQKSKVKKSVKYSAFDKNPESHLKLIRNIFWFRIIGCCLDVITFSFRVAVLTVPSRMTSDSWPRAVKPKYSFYS